MRQTKAMESITIRDVMARLTILFACLLSCVNSGKIQIDLEKYDKKIIKSTNYPECCTKEEFLIRYVNKDKGYLRMVFEDLDFPSETDIKVYDGSNSSSKLFDSKHQPIMSRGTWSKPVIASSGKNIFITVNPKSGRPHRHVGFKAVVWATDVDNSSWTNRPFTDCPRVQDTMDGGEVILGKFPGKNANGKVTFRYDCMWQIKPPRGSDGLVTYLKLIQANLDDGTATIHNNIFSESTTLYTFRADDSASVKGLPYIESEDGFYLKAEKPLDSGEFSFIYGVYQEVEKSGSQVEKANRFKCDFKFQGKTHPGFRCQNNPWCVPIEHSCNKLNNCPDASDESKDYCNTTTKLLVNIGRVLNRDFECKDKKCPDGSCIPKSQKCGEQYHELVECPKGQKFCINGKCIKKNDTCPGNCSHLEWKCDNGMCVSKHYESCHLCKGDEKRCTVSGRCVKYFKRCPESKCHSYKDLWCPHSGECTYQSSKCDGVIDCRDNSDEANCGSSSLTYLFVLLILPAAILFLALTHRKKKLCFETTKKKESDPNDTGMRAPFVSKNRRKNKQRTKSTSSNRSTTSLRSTHKSSGRSRSPVPPKSPHRSPRVSPGNSPHSETVPLVEVKDCSPTKPEINASNSENNHVDADTSDRTPLHV